jgi:hypothetical protein
MQEPLVQGVIAPSLSYALLLKTLSLVYHLYQELKEPQVQVKIDVIIIFVITPISTIQVE